MKENAVNINDMKKINLNIVYFYNWGVENKGS